MSAVFIKLLNLSITASWLILAVILFRFLLRKAPKWINCVLWAMVAVRLVCPFSLESALSLIPSRETVPGNIEMMNSPAIDSGVAIINDAVNPAIAHSFTPNTGDSTNPLQIVLPALSVVWLAGMAAMLIYASVSYIKLKRSTGASITVRENVLACDEVQSPFILGIIRPVIYVPSSIKGETLDYVTAHETAHIQRRDHWWKPLGYLLLTVYWFAPLCWLAYILLCRDIEMACDEKVVRELNNNDKAAYSQALLSCSLKRRKIAACPVAFGEVGVKERVRSVLNYRKPAFWLVAAALAACAMVAVCFMTDPFSDRSIKGRLGVSMDMAVMEHYSPARSDENFIAMDYNVLRVSKRRKTATVYAWIMCEEYSFDGKDVRVEYGSNVPTVITFDTSKAGDASSYDVIEYWEPRDGSYYADDIRSMFPILLWRKAFDNSGAKQQEENCMRAAEEYFGAASTSPAGCYICEQEGFGGRFTLTLNEDGTFSYYEGMLSSYIGIGKWEYDGSTVVLIDNTFEDERRTYFAFDGESLAFDKNNSAAFIYVDLDDGTRFIKYELTENADAFAEDSNSEHISSGDYFAPDYGSMNTAHADEFLKILKQDGYYTDGELDKNYNTDGISSIVNITPKSISDVTSGVEIFLIKDAEHCFLMTDGAIYRYDTFGGYHHKLCLWDYDGNGTKDLVSFDSFGSGIPYLGVSIFDLTKTEFINVVTRNLLNEPEFTFDCIDGRIYIDGEELTYSDGAFRCKAFSEQ